MTDLWAVVWKEGRSLISNRGSVFVGYAIIIVAFGVLMPLDSVPDIAGGRVARPLMIFCFLGVVLSSSQTARSFAGEREMKTLPSLLATRIGDRSLFLGKTLSIVLLSSAMLASAGVLHLVAVNLVSHGTGLGWVFYTARPLFLPYMFLMPLSIVCLTAVIGVLISLKVRSTRGAYLLNLFSGLPAVVVAYVALNLGPWGRSWHTVLASVVVLFGILVTGVGALAVRRFSREALVSES